MTYYALCTTSTDHIVVSLHNCHVHLVKFNCTAKSMIVLDCANLAQSMKALTRDNDMSKGGTIALSTTISEFHTIFFSCVQQLKPY